MRLGTKLTLYLSLIIILVLSGYGYLDILSRRDILVRKTKAEVRSTGRTLGVSLGKVSLPEEKGYVQGLIDAVSEYERTLGVVVYYEEGHRIFHSNLLKEGIEPSLDAIRRSMREDLPERNLGPTGKSPYSLTHSPSKTGPGSASAVSPFSSGLLSWRERSRKRNGPSSSRSSC